MVTTIYLIRHAAYENPKNIFHGRLAGFPLSPEGKEQARRLAEALRGKPIAAVYSSPLTRALQTAEAIARPHGLLVFTDERLLDLRTPLEGKPITYMESIRWNTYRPEFIAAGGETLAEVDDRMRLFFAEKAREHSGKQIVIVSHGDPIATVKARFLKQRLNLSNIRRDYLGVGQGYRITYSPLGVLELFAV